MSSPATASPDCDQLLLKIRRGMVHGSGRYRAQKTYEALKADIDEFRVCGNDLATYLSIHLDFQFSRVGAKQTLMRCEDLLESPACSPRVRIYLLALKARLLVDVIPYAENATLRAEALSIAERTQEKVLAALIKVNWVLPALSRADAATAKERFEEARSAVATLDKRDLDDPDAFGIDARLRAHEAKLVLHLAAERGVPDGSTVSTVVGIYDQVCASIAEYDHLRANYRTELADELHRLAKLGFPAAFEAAETALAAARTSADAHHCELCRGYFHEVAAEHHLLLAQALAEWEPSKALGELAKANREASDGLRIFQSAGHPSAELVREVISKIQLEVQTLEKPNRVFLSHKGTDKGLVRRFRDALAAVKFHPWMDEDALKAGAKLDRGLLSGMKESCAAVFFITPDFVDSSYIATEIDYAIQEERQREPEFRIITLVFSDESGATGTVPPLLERFVWKHPKTELEAFVMIVEALPLTVPVPGWRTPS